MENNSEREWEDFLKYGHIFSPSRQEQFETFLSLLPAQQDESFIAVDLGCGGGALSKIILERFPNAKVIGIDVTEEMLDVARETLAPFGERATLKKFDLKEKQWLSEIPEKVGCFVSSLAIHHLTGEEKGELFKSLYNKLNERGAVLLVDIIEPATEQVGRYFGNLWDKIVEQQSKDITGSLEAYKHFKDIEWNYYHWDEPDEEDTPSPLFDQLKWLEEAGFSKVDCFWLRAGHAIYGGYK